MSLETEREGGSRVVMKGEGADRGVVVQQPRQPVGPGNRLVDAEHVHDRIGPARRGRLTQGSVRQAKRRRRNAEARVGRREPDAHRRGGEVGQAFAEVHAPSVFAEVVAIWDCRETN